MITAAALEDIGEVGPGADLAELIAVGRPLTDGQIVLITSKVISKAEGRTTHGTRDDALPGETVRVVARRGPTSIVENKLGLVMAAAGIDASNVETGTVLLLPLDPDATARRLREDLLARTGANLGVIITDTAGRPWRTGQSDIAIGVAGLSPLVEYAGSDDGYGNQLAVTAPAVADELAGLAELVTGKLGRRPVSVVDGLGGLVLAPGKHGPGARALIRPRSQDLFALGAREAVVAAVGGMDGDCFGVPASLEEVLAALRRCGIEARATGDAAWASADARAPAIAWAHGWRASREGGAQGPEATVSFRPAGVDPR